MSSLNTVSPIFAIRDSASSTLRCEELSGRDVGLEFRRDPGLIIRRGSFLQRSDEIDILIGALDSSSPMTLN